MFEWVLTLTPTPANRCGATERYAVSYSLKALNFTFSVPMPLASVSAPSPYVFCEVHDRRLSPEMNQRSSGVKIEKRIPESTCFFCDTRSPPETDEIRVVFSSPVNRARLLLRPALSPVDGFDAIVGATTKK